MIDNLWWHLTEQVQLLRPVLDSTTGQANSKMYLKRVAYDENGTSHHHNNNWYQSMSYSGFAPSAGKKRGWLERGRSEDGSARLQEGSRNVCWANSYLTMIKAKEKRSKRRVEFWLLGKGLSSPPNQDLCTSTWERETAKKGDIFDYIVYECLSTLFNIIQ